MVCHGILNVILTNEPNVRAVILAGGRGSRLGRLTEDRPKCLIPICGVPVLEHIVVHLVRQGISDITITLGYKAEMVISHMGDGAMWGASLSYTVEEAPSGTAGNLAEAASPMSTQTIIVHGDVLHDIDLDRMSQRHAATDAAATVAVSRSAGTGSLVYVDVDLGGRVLGFVRGGECTDKRLGLNLVPVFICGPRFWPFTGGERPSDLLWSVFARMLRSGEPIYAFETDRYVQDIGTPEGLQAARIYVGC